MPDPGKYLLPAARGLPFADLGDGAAWGRWADDYSAQPCVSLGDETLTYCDLDCRSNAAAHLLLALGVAKGDRVAIMAPNCTLLPALYIACHKIGALAAPLAFLMDLQQLAGQLAAVQPSVVVFHCSVADTILPTAQVLWVGGGFGTDVAGRPEICSEGGGGGAREPQDGGGGRG